MPVQKPAINTAIRSPMEREWNGTEQ